MSKNILFVTGTRADFGKLEPLALACHQKGYSVNFFVTGMHMMQRYGLTKLEVERLKYAHVFNYINQREGDAQDLILAKTVLGFSDFIHEQKPDLVVVHGDRVEALACALVCSTNYIRCAHIEGGEVSGTIDEIFRHCNTKMATYHFVSSISAKNRVLAMGEPESAVFCIGSPELDVHSVPTGLTISEVKQRYEIPFDDYGIVIFHPVTSEQSSIRSQAQKLFNTLQRSNREFVIIAPNNDPGSNDIFEIIGDLPNNQFRLIASMRFSYFSELLRNAQAILGNSSVGVREAPFLGLPSLNIGSRQNNRSESATIIQTDASDTNKIENFLKREWGMKHSIVQEFGTGNSATNFVKELERESFWNQSLQKEFCD